MTSFLIGYVYDSNGCYDKKYFIENKVETIARFIMQFPMNDKVITNPLDMFLCSTNGCFLHQVSDSFIASQLQEALIPYQSGEKELQALEFTEKWPGYLTQTELLTEREAV